MQLGKANSQECVSSCEGTNRDRQPKVTVLKAKILEKVQPITATNNGEVVLINNNNNNNNNNNFKK